MHGPVHQQVSTFLSPMASLVRLARLAPRVVQSRGIAYTSVIRNEATSNLGAVHVQKKPVGGFRGGHACFLLGVAAFH